jgi:hypothetical protein
MLRRSDFSPPTSNNPAVPGKSGWRRERIKRVRLVERFNESDPLDRSTTLTPLKRSDPALSDLITVPDPRSAGDPAEGDPPAELFSASRAA